MIFIISIILVIIPFAIVGFWKNRPVLSIIVATVIAYLMMIIPALIQTFQAMMIYGSGDPQLMVGGISEALVSSTLALVVVLPLLLIFQLILRVIRNRNARKSAKLRQFE